MIEMRTSHSFLMDTKKIEKSISKGDDTSSDSQDQDKFLLSYQSFTSDEDGEDDDSEYEYDQKDKTQEIHAENIKI